ncbi:LysM-like peptidoglycan-binding domain-containing protein [Yersinia kristensenii]|uniref:LysM-like peptidoglycan-binding domain-containing protein n=1 Tax=Yersinia kristensenii TaxID=28152 RepID=UPI000C1ED488|nr:OapA family protein [Yersinia kristensenii]MDA5471492.1 OapA family protein [Yersinia kristensenii]MDA5475536.1 OapA family protein [Yersinia kristensenii]MDA5506075.1 OapA family protein [Yersinia kristensenii]NIK95400.1 lysine transporter LysM [Yersinia kristensenii]NIL06664.1 lysine transporter LysM [Yersinia kristensenii]
MGRIAPRRRKSTRIYQPLLHTWLSIRQRVLPATKNADDQNLMSEVSASEHISPAEDIASTENKGSPETVATAEQGKGIKGLLLKIWHLPDSFEWMEPLPLFHRRWVIIATTVLLLALLWPVSRDNTNNTFPVSAPSTDVPLQAQLQGNLDAPPLQGNWQSYQIQSGKTLAQLFRDNNLPVNEVFAMARVEGNDKPLSNLKAGQEVKIMLDAEGVVAALAIESANSTEVLFTRQNDGSYRRER